jgi:hypothetical protein
VKDANARPRGDDVTQQGCATTNTQRSNRGGAALVASMTTWAIAWLLFLRTLVPQDVVGRSGLDIAWGLVGLLIFAVAVVMMCGAISAVFASSGYALSGASWVWNRLTGRDSPAEMLGGPAGLALALILSAAAVTGWLWLVSEAMRLALVYAGWSR